MNVNAVTAEFTEQLAKPTQGKQKQQDKPLI